jgi:hypothetical protein
MGDVHGVDWHAYVFVTDCRKENGESATIERPSCTNRGTYAIRKKAIKTIQ